jgi:hypothetical protein
MRRMRRSIRDGASLGGAPVLKPQGGAWPGAPCRLVCSAIGDLASTRISDRRRERGSKTPFGVLKLRCIDLGIRIAGSCLALTVSSADRRSSRSRSKAKIKVKSEDQGQERCVPEPGYAGTRYASETSGFPPSPHLIPVKVRNHTDGPYARAGEAHPARASRKTSHDASTATRASRAARPARHAAARTASFQRVPAGSSAHTVSSDRVMCLARVILALIDVMTSNLPENY